MAYMSKEHAKQIRDNLKKAFPEFKFSVTITHNTGISVAILSSPLDFSEDLNGSGNIEINHYHIDIYKNAETFKKMYDIINEGNFDESDLQSDYFHVGFYVYLSVGKWDKVYQQKVEA